MVLQNTGVFNSRERRAIPGMDVRKDVLTTTAHADDLHPRRTERHRVCERHGRLRADQSRAGAVANLPVGHGGTYFEPNGGAAASVAVSWLDWQLRGDLKSAERFVGENCGLCRDAQWTLERKQFPRSGWPLTRPPFGICADDLTYPPKRFGSSADGG